MAVLIIKPYYLGSILGILIVGNSYLLADDTSRESKARARGFENGAAVTSNHCTLPEMLQERCQRENFV